MAALGHLLLKQCARCGVFKSRHLFGIQKKQRLDGLNYYCKECDKTYHANWQNKNREKINSYARSYRKKNTEAVNFTQKRCRVKNHAKIAAYNMMRICKKIRATPKWANKLAIAKAYVLADYRSKLTGFKWEVDHIVPLNSPIVCGLHVENNLQVITKSKNIAKSNKFFLI